MPRGVKEHIHKLVPHCKNNSACPWVACSSCGFYGTLDGRHTAYRTGYGPGDPTKGQKA